jgi:retron-type reverse transcriptase
LLTSYLKNSKSVESELHRQDTLQGSVISSLLVNIALSGMESYVIGKNKKSIKLIRYADDIVILSTRYDLIMESKYLLSVFLNKINIKLLSNKTYIGHTQYLDNGKNSIVGLNYLGYRFRNFETSIHRGIKNTRGVKQVFKQEVVPSRKSVQCHKINIKNILRQYKNAPLEVVISKLSLLIRD